MANREAEGRKLGVLAGVPAMGLDGFASAAYGPEAALTVLAATGAAGLAHIGPITWAILALLAILGFSYWQTIAAYPNNGGSYVVARENLGTDAGLLAAAALMVDYMLNVAVGISAGVGALTSALPSLHPDTLWLCLGILLLVTIANLRGTREAGLAWAVPTYGFVASLGFVLAWGVVKALAGDGHPAPVIAPPPAHQAAEAVTLWLLLRAFASGCTAMTGVEAVSNGVSAFREPRVRHAHGTLTVIVVVLGILLLGIAHLARVYGVAAMDQSQPGYQSVLSQLAGAVAGRGWLYYVTIGCVLAVLSLSANTSFVDFPRLCHLLARDQFLPRAFALPGRRLVYAAGIVFLALGSGALLTAFGGITDRLIPLFAVGAFLAFTLSQAGMAAHWWRAPQSPGHRHAGRLKLLVNGTGAVATGAALIVILLAKFAEGAWLTVIVIPSTVLLLRAIRRYYAELDSQLLTGCARRLNFPKGGHAIVLVPIKRWDRIAAKAIDFAVRISDDVTAVHVLDLGGPDDDDRGEEERLGQEWRDLVQRPAREAGLPSPRLEIARSPYRSVVAPLLRAIERATRRSPASPVFVVVPEIVVGRWWAKLLHTRLEHRLRTRLLRYGGPSVAVIGVPWQLRAAAPAEGVAEEEPAPAA